MAKKYYFSNLLLIKLCFAGIMSDIMLKNVQCYVNIFKLLFCN